MLTLLEIVADLGGALCVLGIGAILVYERGRKL